jgi:hypothetical protein
MSNGQRQGPRRVRPGSRPIVQSFLVGHPYLTRLAEGRWDPADLLHNIRIACGGKLFRYRVPCTDRPFKRRDGLGMDQFRRRRPISERFVVHQHWLVQAAISRYPAAPPPWPRAGERRSRLRRTRQPGFQKNQRRDTAVVSLERPTFAAEYPFGRAMTGLGDRLALMAHARRVMRARPYAGGFIHRISLRPTFSRTCLYQHHILASM